jgi:formylmethanofuran dehydrogenase subunit E
MSRDSEFFIPKHNVYRSERKALKKVNHEKKFVRFRCVECNELIGVVSITLYEIDEKHYCSKCYSQKIINMAVERDHFDIKQEKKEALQK